MTSEFAVAVHALVFLNHKAKTLSSEEIAQNVCTNPARIRKVLTKLKKANLVQSKEGSIGGYHFGQNAKDVNLRQVLCALNEPAVRAKWHSGNKDNKCLIASGMAGVLDDICAQLDESCQARLAQITIYDIDQKIFGKGK